MLETAEGKRVNYHLLNNWKEMTPLKYLLFVCLLKLSIQINAQYESDKIVLGGGTFDDNFLPPIPARNSIIYVNQSNGIDSINGSNWLKITILLNVDLFLYN